MGHPQDVTLRRPQDVTFQRLKDVGRRCPTEVSGDVPWCYIEDHIRTSIGRVLVTSSERPRDIILNLP